MIYNYEFALDSLREKIAMILNQSGASFETGAIADMPTSIVVLKTDIYAAIDKLISQTTPIGTSGETFSLSLSDTNIIAAVDALLADYTPEVAASPTSSASIVITINDIVSAVDLYIKDNMPKVQGSATTIPDYTYNVQTLIPEIDKLIKDEAPKLEGTGTPANISIVRDEIIQKVNKLTIDRLPIESSSESAWGTPATLILDNPTLIASTELKIKDNAPKIGTALGSGITSVYTLDSLVTKVNSLLSDHLPKEGSTLADWGTPATKVYTQDELNTIIELKIKDQSPSVAGNTSPYSATEQIPLVNITTKAKSGSAYYANKMPDKFDELTLTDDESALMILHYTEGLKHAESRLNKIVSSIAINGSNVDVVFVSTLSLTTYIGGLITDKLEQYLSDYILYKWYLNLGEPVANGYLESCNSILEWCESVTYKKYETLASFNLVALGMVAEKIQDLLSDYSSLTFTFKQTRFNSASKAAFISLITDVVTSYSANQWLNKLGAEGRYASRMNEFDMYLNDKYTIVSSYIESAFTIVGSRLEKILSGAITTGSSYTVSYIATGSLTTTSKGILEDLIEDCVTKQAANSWAANLNIQSKHDVRWDELNFFVNEKYESLTSFNGIMASMIAERIQDIISDYNPTTLTYTFKNSRFNAATKSALTELIKDVITSYSSYQWLSKMGVGVQYTNRMGEFDIYTKNKYNTLLSYIDNVIGEVGGKIDTLLSGAITLNTDTYTIPILATNSITATTSAIMSDLVQDIISKQVANQWAATLGINTKHEVRWSELEYYVNEKYESLESYISTAFNKIETKLTDLMDAAILFSKPTYTISLSPNFNLSLSASNSLNLLIKDIVIKFAAEQWCIKMGLQYKPEVRWVELDNYVFEKYETIKESVSKTVALITDKLQRILTNVTSTSTSHTFTIENTYNIDAAALTSVQRIVKEIIISEAVNQWVVKLGGQISPIDYTILDKFTYSKKESIIEFASESFRFITSYLVNLIPVYGYVSPTHTLTATVAGNLNAASADILENLVKDYVYNTAADKWANKVGIKSDLSKSIESLKQEMFKYSLNKYDTYSASISKRAFEVQQRIKFITSAVFTNTTSVTYTVKDGGNFDSITIQNITGLITKYLINISASDWLVKLSDKSVNYYTQESDLALNELVKYNELKRSIIDVELKRAAYRVYDNFMFSGKSLIRPVLFDESYTYPDQTDITDDVNIFDIDGITIDATDKIYYWFNMHGNWEDSQNYSLDDKLEESLITFVLKEYYRMKPELINLYSITQQRYADLISSIRQSLFVRLKNKATRRGVEFI